MKKNIASRKRNQHSSDLFTLRNIIRTIKI